MTTLDALRDILKTDFGATAPNLQPDTRLDDLGIDSLAVIEVMFALEEKFGITVPSEPAAIQGQSKTLGDLAAYVDTLIAEQNPAIAKDR